MLGSGNTWVEWEDGCRYVRYGVVSEQAPTEGQKSGTTTSSEEAERADADKAAR
jgi:hypothetical protein